MTLLLNHGERRVLLPTPPAKTTAGETKYAAQADGKELTVTILDLVCADTMSGMPHPSTVVVIFSGKELRCCDGDPAALLQGAEWVVEQIDGADLVRVPA
jgi:uncharacterized membrane protein